MVLKRAATAQQEPRAHKLEPVDTVDPEDSLPIMYANRMQRMSHRKKALEATQLFFPQKSRGRLHHQIVVAPLTRGRTVAVTSLQNNLIDTVDPVDSVGRQACEPLTVARVDPEDDAYPEDAAPRFTP